MKVHQITASPLRPALLAAAFALILPAAVAADHLKPIGELDAMQSKVRSGKKAHLKWSITYPAALQDILQIGPQHRLDLEDEVTVRVQVLGMDYTTVKSNNGHGNNVDGVDVSNPGQGGGGPNGEVDRSGPIDDEKRLNGNAKVRGIDLEAILWVKTNQSPWNEVFAGDVSDLDGGEIYFEADLPAGSTVDFAAQGKSRQGWNEVISTTTPSPYVVALRNGDPVPEVWGEIASFLSGYVEDGKMALGPLQMIYLFDLDADSVSSPKYTLQDLALLVSFEEE